MVKEHNKSIGELQGIEDSRKYKLLIESLWEFQDRFQHEYPNYLCRIDVNHDTVGRVIRVLAVLSLGGPEIRFGFELDAAAFRDPWAIDRIAMWTKNASTWDGLKKDIARKIFEIPETEGTYEEQAVAFEEKAWHEDLDNIRGTKH